jgi:hypothetical protein
MANTTFVLGQSAYFNLVINNKPVVIFCHKWDVKPNVTKIEDQVNGEKRSRVGTYPNYFEGTMETKYLKSDIIDALLSLYVPTDSDEVPLEVGAGCLITPPGQSRAAYIISNMTIDDWGWSVPGQKQSQIITIPWRAQEFKKAASF